MNEFFSIYTLTPWDNLKTEVLTQIRVLSLKSIFKNYPVIEPAFFDDLSSKLNKNQSYSWSESIKRVIGPQKEDYDISHFSFLWAFDIHNRMYQFLFQKEDEQGILAGLAPPELGKLFSEHGKGALLRTLSILNDSSLIKFLMLLTPKGKSIAQERQLFQIDKQQYEKMKYIETLKNQPNIAGKWFPSFEIRCPACNELLFKTMFYKVGFDKFKCPRCGFEKK